MALTNAPSMRENSSQKTGKNLDGALANQRIQQLNVGTNDGHFAAPDGEY
jgi:hypothetical protein